MAKRFTDSRKWHDPWYRKLPPEYKNFWIYLLDTCDHAGIWKVDFEMAEFCIGGKINIPDITSIFNERVIQLKEGLWFIPKFIEFQYGDLNPDNRAHKSVMDILEKEGANKHLVSPLLGCKDKDKDKVKDTVKEKDKIKKFDFDPVWALYPKKIGKKEAFGYFNTTVKDDKDRANIQKAIENYLKHIEAEKVPTRYIKKGCNWFDDWEDWVDFIVEAPEPEPEKFKFHEVKASIEKQLGKMATDPMIEKCLLGIPKNAWWMVGAFLKRRFPDGGEAAYCKIETKLSRED